MGNQGHSGDGARLICEWIAAGAIGPVREVHAWTNRPVWPQGIEVDRPAETPPFPASLDWDLWLGPAPVRPHHPTYHPGLWRAWWDGGMMPPRPDDLEEGRRMGDSDGGVLFIGDKGKLVWTCSPNESRRCERGGPHSPTGRTRKGGYGIDSNENPECGYLSPLSRRIV